MGRIKTSTIKNLARDIMEKNDKEKFTGNFQSNKEILENVVDIPSKKQRNVLAGYITRLINKERK